MLFLDAMADFYTGRDCLTDSFGDKQRLIKAPGSEFFFMKGHWHNGLRPALCLIVVEEYINQRSHQRWDKLKTATVLNMLNNVVNRIVIDISGQALIKNRRMLKALGTKFRAGVRHGQAAKRTLCIRNRQNIQAITTNRPVIGRLASAQQAEH